MTLRVLACLLLVACGVSREAFPERAARTSCTQQRSCDRESFEDVWADLATCIDDVTAGIELTMDAIEVFDALDLCEYDPAAAADVLSTLKRSGCDDADFDGELQNLYDCG